MIQKIELRWSETKIQNTVISLSHDEENIWCIKHIIRYDLVVGTLHSMPVNLKKNVSR
jgi:hypothetical protein